MSTTIREYECTIMADRPNGPTEAVRLFAMPAGDGEHLLVEIDRVHVGDVTSGWQLQLTREDARELHRKLGQLL